MPVDTIDVAGKLLQLKIRGVLKRLIMSGSSGSRRKRSPGRGKSER